MRYFEDFHVGEIMPLGPYTVSEEEIIEFAKKYDPQFFHADPIAAKESVFGGIIASGWHTASIFMRMQYDSFLYDSKTIASPGTEKIDWLIPVRPGDTLTGTNEVINTRVSKSKPDRGLVECRVIINNHHDDMVMRLTTKAFFHRHPDS